MSQKTRSKSRTKADAMAAPGFSIEAIFHFLWVCVALEDKHYRMDWKGAAQFFLHGELHLGILDLALLVVGGAVLVRPSSRKLFAIFCLVMTAVIIGEIPSCGNDTIVALALNFLLLKALFDHRSNSDKSVSYLDELSGPAATLLSLTYMLAVLHKLNWGFLLSPLSCVADFTGRIHHFFSFVPLLSGQPIVLSGAIATILTESVLAVGLLFRRTRNYVFFIGTLFHLMLGLTVDTFSSTVLSMYLLLLPKELPAHLARQIPARLLRSDRAWRFTALLWLVALYYFGRNSSAGDYPEYRSMRFVWFLFTASLCGGLFFWAKGQKVIALPERNLCFKANRALWIVICFLFVLNGFGPYLGFRTTLSFSMFSNLRVEGMTNHLFIRKGSLQLFDEIDDLATVEIERKSGKRNRQAYSVPYSSLYDLLIWDRRYFADRILTIRHGEQVMTLAPEAGIPAEFAPPSFWHKKLFSFRPFPPAQPNLCLW